MRQRHTVGISFSKSVLDELDRQKGLVTRSRYLEDLILRSLKVSEK